MGNDRIPVRKSELIDVEAFDFKKFSDDIQKDL